MCFRFSSFFAWRCGRVQSERESMPHLGRQERGLGWDWVKEHEQHNDWIELERMYSFFITRLQMQWRTDKRTNEWVDGRYAPKDKSTSGHISQPYCIVEKKERQWKQTAAHIWAQDNWEQKEAKKWTVQDNNNRKRMGGWTSKQRELGSGKKESNATTKKKGWPNGRAWRFNRDPYNLVLVTP